MSALGEDFRSVRFFFFCGWCKWCYIGVLGVWREGYGTEADFLFSLRFFSFLVSSFSLLLLLDMRRNWKKGGGSVNAVIIGLGILPTDKEGGACLLRSMREGAPCTVIEQLEAKGKKEKKGKKGRRTGCGKGGMRCLVRLVMFWMRLCYSTMRGEDGDWAGAGPASMRLLLHVAAA